MYQVNFYTMRFNGNNILYFMNSNASYLNFEANFYFDNSYTGILLVYWNKFVKIIGSGEKKFIIFPRDQLNSLYLAIHTMRSRYAVWR